MQFWIQTGKAFLWVAVIQVLLTRDAQAYLDPGTMGSLFQMVVASLLGALIVLKLYYRRLSAAVRNFVSPKKEAEKESDQDQAI